MRSMLGILAAALYDPNHPQEKRFQEQMKDTTAHHIPHNLIDAALVPPKTVTPPFKSAAEHLEEHLKSLGIKVVDELEFTPPVLPGYIDKACLQIAKNSTDVVADLLIRANELEEQAKRLRNMADNLRNDSYSLVDVLKDWSDLMDHCRNAAAALSTVKDVDV